MDQMLAPTRPDPFGARATLTTSQGNTVGYFRLPALADQKFTNLDTLPFTVRILLENALRHLGTEFVDPEDVEALATWQPKDASDKEVELPFLPGRVVLQDFTGVPAVVDLAAMRSAVARLGGDVTRINPLVPADLVIDHSVQVDRFGTMLAFARNVELEYERNQERYALLRWGQQSFQNFRVVPPGTGIVHQVNLEYLASVVATRPIGSETVAFPDTLVGTDSHTTMINGLGVLGWGVGGIEAEAVLLGQPLYQLTPEVIGVRLTGSLKAGATATDLVLYVTELLRGFGVVGRFVEFFGAGLSNLRLADRATIANMAPEYGATASLFPVDDETLLYLRMTGRPDDTIDLVERYCKEQGLFRTDETPDPTYNDVLELDLGTVMPSVAGPRRPQDRVPIGQLRRVFRSTFNTLFEGHPLDVEEEQEITRLESEGGATADGAATAQAATTATATAPRTKLLPRIGDVSVDIGGAQECLHHGAVAIAAITSCTNTSNPSVMLGAGLLARNAVERGLHTPEYVKTSMAPGSQVVTRYLTKSGLLPYLEALGFHIVGYGCTTCIGNSGPLPPPVAEAVDENNLVVAAVLSGNRNFEGRIHPQVRASFLASPPLVVAYALAGSVDINLNRDPIGNDPNGDPVYLKDIWPSQKQVLETIESSVDPAMFAEEYKSVFTGDERWQELPVPEGNLYEWDPDSTYVQEPPFFQDLAPEPEPLADVAGARVLVMVGDSVTTDHISPAGSIARTSPAAAYLMEHDVKPYEFNSYGSRRGNHEVMIRGTFANIRLKNLLIPGKEGNWTLHLPTGEETSVYEAAMRYQAEGTPLIVLAGKEYGAGSSRDWAAKGTLLLGVKAVIAESFERIPRSNLVGMGVLPLQYLPGQNAATLGLTGHETFAIGGIADGLDPKEQLKVTATGDDGATTDFTVVARIDSPVEIEYYRHGGILQMVLRRLARTTASA
ncbi:MAG: aconitate hydratase [Thermomicrobiales bacterium]